MQVLPDEKTEPAKEGVFRSVILTIVFFLQQ